MDIYFYANTYFIKLVIATMVVFLGSEFMAIFPVFTNFKKHKETVERHIVPIWEITGTTIVVFVVELELIYSSLTPIASYLFIPLVGTFILLLILRNVWIIYAEFIWKNKHNRVINSENFYKGYLIATFIMVILFLTAIVTLMYGKGIHLNLTDLSASYISYIPILSTYNYWLFLLGTLFVAYGLSAVFYRTMKIESFVPLTTVIIGLILSISGLYGIAIADKVPSGDLYLLIIPLILTLIIPVLYMNKRTTNIASYKPVFFILLVFAVFIIEAPVTYIAGGAFPISNFASANSMQAFNLYLSILGGIIFLGFMIMYAYVYANNPEKFGMEKPLKKETVTK